ncbi:Holliday junction resolvase RuvX [Patescibacteria group bacterium]|nr:Holliday junction resolvase RuvX [Patescibacteria group bacterium]MBU0776780.1 Holliday junction resolvase RuvX [Patescibacteria group bacterium]MBU0846353.1 Holliday junction resolvase RuvX [Patescibacteria group bacterium]MBU0922687.1 Holliday junction resolvase RuvX [Patescibacteria group bacterium]MBU1066738.1 Holliday junction resolvase RuvX [Patescibacteria group bacterium]
MRILAIDYGQKKVGVALATSQLAEPYKVIRFTSSKTLVKELGKIIEEEQIEKLIIGVSEGKIGEESKRFGEKLKIQFKLPLSFQDETLTTQEAQKLSFEAGIKRKKRKKLEDAFSAALILQAYLDSK